MPMYGWYGVAWGVASVVAMQILEGFLIPDVPISRDSRVLRYAIFPGVIGLGLGLLAAFGAVLAGAVWGDHCSPISDTTILSSTGASCNVITHVMTQLPYAISGAVIALLGYAVFAATGSGWLGFVAVLVGLVVVAILGKTVLQRLEDEIPEEEQAERSLS